jgi:hypothetical protein
VAASDEDEDADEPLELDEVCDGLEADLDGDGKPEAISWTCDEDDTLHQITIAGTRARHRLDVSNVMGCCASIVDLDAGRPGSELWFVADVHDEVGADGHWLLRFDGRRLVTVWRSDVHAEFFADGSWSTVDYECDAGKHEFRTITSRWRIGPAGKPVASEQVESKQVSEDWCSSEDNDP